MKLPTVLLSIIYLALMLPTTAHACSLLPAAYFQVLTEPATDAISPPPAVSIDQVSVKRGVGPVEGGCGSASSTSCDDIGWTTFSVNVPQSAEPYGLVVESRGNVPAGLIPTEPIQAADRVSFSWGDGALDEQEELDFAIRITAINADGQMGDTSEWFRVYHAGSQDGCSTTPLRNLGGLLPLIVLGCVLLVVRVGRGELGKA